MKPREDVVGVILNRQEAGLCALLDEAERELAGPSKNATEDWFSEPIALDLNSDAQEFSLNEEQTQRLWRVSFWAATKYLENYKAISEVHDEIVTSQDIGRRAIADYLVTLEAEMRVAAARYNTAKSFALAVDSARDHSRSRLMSNSSL